MKVRLAGLADADRITIEVAGGDHRSDAERARATELATLDQRDATRPAAAGCDSGAVEVGGSFDLVFYDGFD